MRAGTYFSASLSEWVYSSEEGELFPLVRRRGWCQECNTITFHEHIPAASEIDAFVDDIRRQLREFESGERPWYGKSRADHARLVITNRKAWHQWRTTRTRGRCIACGSDYVTKIDPLFLGKGEGMLAFTHPGCGGALILGTDEEGFHASGSRPSAEDQITYITYSFAGLPTNERLEETKKAVDARHPGLLVELRRLVAEVASGMPVRHDVSAHSPADGGSRLDLSRAFRQFVRNELADGAPDPSNADALQVKYTEIHQLTAVLIRDLICRLPARQRNRTPRPGVIAQPRLDVTTALHRNPFHILRVGVRDDKRKIVAQAEEQALHGDSDAYQKARSDLTNPRTRLAAEMAWLPGLSPRRASNLIDSLNTQPLDIRRDRNLPALAKANLWAAAAEAIGSEQSSDEMADFIQEFAVLVGEIDPEDVLKQINEDRAVSGFPEIRGVEQLELELAERKRYYRGALRDALNRMTPQELVAAMTHVVENATCSGEVQAPELVDELVDAYALETQDVLEKESQNAEKLIRAALANAKRGEAVLHPIIDKLEAVAKTWNTIAQPIQLSKKARGLEHDPSTELGSSIRRLAVELFNSHDLLEQSQRLTNLLADLFSAVPEFAERVEQDAEALKNIFLGREEAATKQAEWVREIAYRVEVGMVFKDTLSLSAEGISWKGQHFPLDAITRVRWGSVRHSVNGIPTGTTFTIAFGDRRSEAVVELRNKQIYTVFVDKLWRAVAVRMLTRLLEALKEGRQITFGDADIKDSGVSLTRHRFLGREQVSLEWRQTHVWSANGSFFIAAKGDKKVYAKLPYITMPNVHILEQAIRMAYKRPGMRALSDLLSGN